MKNTVLLPLPLLFLLAPDSLSAQDRKICFQKAPPVGYCYVLADQKLSNLPSGPLYWHLYTYPTLAAAPKDPMNTVAEADGKVWLFRIAV